MADENCPKIKYLFDDCKRTTTGSYKCMAQNPQFEDASCRTSDYRECDQQNYRECPFLKIYNKKVTDAGIGDKA